MIFKKIFIKFMEWLDSYYNKDYLKQIKDLEDKVKEKERLLDEYTIINSKEKDELATSIEVLKVELSEMTKERDKFKKDLDNCMLELLSVGEPEVLKPDWLVNHMLYKPRRRFVSKIKDIDFPFKKPQHCFDKSTVLYDLMKEKGLYKIPKTYENLKKVKKLISEMSDYFADLMDNWRSTSDFIICLFGDCEDFAIAITSALGIAGWKEDEVFVSVGYYYPKGKSVDPNNKYCHAWCKAKCNGKWYVLEGTDPRAVPRLWEDWKDKYEETLGCCNWNFEGMIKGGKTYM